MILQSLLSVGNTFPDFVVVNVPSVTGYIFTIQWRSIYQSLRWISTYPCQRLQSFFEVRSLCGWRWASRRCAFLSMFRSFPWIDQTYLEAEMDVPPQTSQKVSGCRCNCDHAGVSLLAIAEVFSCRSELMEPGCCDTLEFELPFF